MNPILKIFWLIYIIFIDLPLALLFTFLTAISTLIGCTIGDHKKWGYYPGMIWSRLMCALIFSTVKVEGKENLEKGQSYVFAANHTSTYDIFIIYGYIGRSFKWVMKEEIRKIPFVGAACKAAGFIFINRKAMKQALHSMEEAKKSLTNGVSVVIFPEGTRTKTGEMGRFKQGAFKIAMDMGLPVVPLSLGGFFKAMPSGQAFANPRARVSLHIGKPIDISQFNDINEAMEYLRNEIAKNI